jgi:hypothetical protein
MKSDSLRARTRVVVAKSSIVVALIALHATACSSGEGSKTSESACSSVDSLVARPSARLFLTSSVLERLKARAAAGDPAWTELKKECTAMTTGTVNAPNAAAYPNAPNIGAGYQGESYLPAVMAMGLCYRVAAGTDSAAEASYGAAGARILDAMSTPVGSGGQAPSTDSGYGIRNFGVGMAFGYDWLYPALSSATRSRVIASLNTWVDWYDVSGFSRTQPIGNYFAGYLLAKTATALATEGDNPKASGYFEDVSSRLWGTLVKPAFQKSMSGGGWPEGWGYGPRAVRSVLEFLWAVKTSKGLDWGTEVPQARDQASYLAHFSWPSLEHMDDQGTVRSGTKIAPSAALASEVATVLSAFSDASAGLARSFAADVIAAGDDRKAWEKFLYWDDAQPKTSRKAQPLSYAAVGPGQVAMRSSWALDAAWGALSGGTYINAPDSGEQMFNQGSLSVVLGDDPVLVNATGQIPQLGGTAGENFVYADTWEKKSRTLYNTFFVNDSQNPFNPGQAGVTPDKAQTRIERYEEAGGYVHARAADVQQMYQSPAMKQFSRDLVYARPGTFVLFDRTSVTSGADQWMAFHVASAPKSVAGVDKRFDVARGSIRMLLPASSKVTTGTLPGGITRLEEHSSAADQRWLTVISASATVPDEVRLSAADGNVAAGNLVGVHVQAARNQVVLFSDAAVGEARYTVKQTADADHIVADATPSANYTATATAANGALTIDLKSGGPLKASAQGTLCYSVTTSGTVAPCDFPKPVAEPDTPGTDDAASPAQSPNSGTAPSTPCPH